MSQLQRKLVPRASAVAIREQLRKCLIDRTTCIYSGQSIRAQSLCMNIANLGLCSTVQHRMLSDSAPLRMQEQQQPPQSHHLQPIIMMPQLVKGQMHHPITHLPQSPATYKPVYDLITMFDACIESRRMARALAIIDGLREEVSAAQTEELLSRYLQVVKMVTLETADASYLINTWMKLKAHRITFSNSVIIAQFCECALLLQDKPLGKELTKQFCNAYLSSNEDATIDHILTQCHILRLKHVKQICNLFSVALPEGIDSKYGRKDANTYGLQPIQKQNSATLWEELDRKLNKDYDPSEVKAISHLVFKEDNPYLSADFTFRGESAMIPTREAEKQEILKLLPIVKRTKTGSLGLATVHASLKTLLDPKAAEKDESIQEALNDKYYDNLELYANVPHDLARQKMLERSSDIAASKRWEHDYEKLTQKVGITFPSKNLNALLWSWHRKLVPYIKEYIQNATKAEQEESEKKGKPKYGTGKAKDLSDLEKQTGVFKRPTKFGSLNESLDKAHYLPFICVLSPEKLSILTILEMIRLYGSGGFKDGIRVSRAFVSVGKAIEREFHAKTLRSSEARGLLGRHKNLKEVISDSSKFSKAISLIKKRENTQLKKPLIRSWSPEIRAKVGGVLVTLLMKCAKIKQKAPNADLSQEAFAFFHTYQYVGVQNVGMIKYHDNLLKEISQRPVPGIFHYTNLPMLVPPLTWSDWKSGGYLYTPTTAMRMKDAPEQKTYLKAASDAGQLTEVFKALDVLGSTAWTINTKIFELMLEVWNSGEGFPGFPPEQLPIEKEFKQDEPLKNDLQSVKKRKQQAIDIANNLSRRCEMNYKIEVGRAFINEKFYFPHSYDFRGRAYPIPSYFNHLGNDAARAMLIFNDAKKLGSRGLFWLKVHFANLCGHDKVPFEERVAFTESHIDQIMECSDHPLDGSKWWTQFDDCWQVLAVCFELTSALRSPDPTEYRSGLPVHQDGSCNGLQHYAALGGDVAGGEQVNLCPGERPRDVYSAVAKAVQQMVKEDAENGNSKNQEYAKLLQDKITRKVVKQSVMTNVYGVTFVGMRAQIQSQLMKLHNLPAEETYRMATYLSHKTNDALKNLFRNAHEIQKWLQDSAASISRSFNETMPGSAKMNSVIWTTPLNLPIVQPYRSSLAQEVRTSIQIMKLSDPDSLMPVLTRKQASAFPPNFIHSLDATHMIMSALECDRRNIVFAAVHDSYWTHACDIDELSVVTREQFVKLHNQDIMGNLKKEFERRYVGFKEIISASTATPIGKRLLYERKLKQENQRLAQKEAAHKDADAKSATEQHHDKEVLINAQAEEIVLPNDKSKEGLLSNEKAIPKRVNGIVPLVFRDLPKRGELDIEVVRQSKYFFS